MPATAPASRRFCSLTTLLLLAAAAPAAAVVDLTFTAPKAIKVGSIGLEYFKVNCILKNTGTEPDGYDVLRRDQALPPGWATSLMLGGPDGWLTNGLPGVQNPPFVDSVYAGSP